MKKLPTNNAYFKKILDNLLALDILFSTNPGINFIITKGILIDNTVSEKELKEDIQYYVNPSNTYIGSTLLRSDDLKSTVFQSEKLPQDYEVSSIGQDRYVLKVPYSDLKNKNMEYIYINVNDCNSMIYNTNNIMECSDRECYENEDCPIGSYCDKNTCKIRLCDNCQIINDHECISKCEARNACETANCQENICTYTKKEACCLIDSDCNDKLSCTEDSCINQKCSNQEVTCEGSKDECTIGKCEEEQGCIYYTKDECTDFSSITGNAINDIIMSRPGIITARIITIATNKIVAITGLTPLFFITRLNIYPFYIFSLSMFNKSNF